MEINKNEISGVELSDLQKKPLCLIVLGFAGSGKSSFVKSLGEYLSDVAKRPYTINLDPAVVSSIYEANVDIRDTINHKEVMKEYKLGPNGAIVTCLNLFCTNMFDLVNLIDGQTGKTDTVIIDTPGQIEVFKWSASGRVITETLASSMPTAIIYVIDSVRSVSPVTFMSNMMYASGIALENELPFIMVMTKTDIVDCSYMNRWMDDTLEFIEDMEAVDSKYMSSMVRQMAFALETFYSTFRRCGVSSETKEGMKEFVDMLKDSRKEYFDDYLKVVLPEKLKNKEQYTESIFIKNKFDEDEENVSDFSDYSDDDF